MVDDDIQPFIAVLIIMVRYDDPRPHMASVLTLPDNALGMARKASINISHRLERSRSSLGLARVLPEQNSGNGVGGK